MKSQKKKDVFFPPGVQVKLYQRLGNVPRMLPLNVVSKINALWDKRNICPEKDIEAIDKEMVKIVIRQYGEIRTISAKG